MDTLVRISPQAHADIKTIYDFVKKDGEDIAKNQAKYIYGEIEHLAQFPNIGIPLQKYVSRKTDLRILVVRKVYIVIYNSANTVDVIRVFRKEQDFIAALGLGAEEDD